MEPAEENENYKTKFRIKKSLLQATQTQETYKNNR